MILWFYELLLPTNKIWLNKEDNYKSKEKQDLIIYPCIFTFFSPPFFLITFFLNFLVFFLLFFDIIAFHLTIFIIT